MRIKELKDKCSHWTHGCIFKIGVVQCAEAKGVECPYDEIDLEEVMAELDAIE